MIKYQKNNEDTAKTLLVKAKIQLEKLERKVDLKLSALLIYINTMEPRERDSIYSELKIRVFEKLRNFLKVSRAVKSKTDY
jgi:hypothetical protein